MNRLREFRDRSGISQTELCVRTGISTPSISRIENDPDPNITLRTAKALARALECTVDDLFPSDAPVATAQEAG